MIYNSFASWQTASNQEKISGANVGSTANPLFVGSGGGALNYRVAVGSPMLGAGVNLSTQYGISPGATDYFGNLISAAGRTVSARHGQAHDAETETIMALAVVTVASGGVPVVDVTATTPKLGLPVTEALRGIAVTKVTLPKGGLPVTYVAGPLLRAGTFEEQDENGRARGI